MIKRFQELGEFRVGPEHNNCLPRTLYLNLQIHKLIASRTVVILIIAFYVISLLGSCVVVAIIIDSLAIIQLNSMCYSGFD